jgi:hypothetical protein
VAKRNIGLVFQDKTGELLRAIEEETGGRIRAVRLYDTSSARGNSLPAQPGDHLVVMHGKTILIEEKASEVHSSLRSGLSSLMDKPQAGQHRLWARTGNPSVVIFYSAVTGVVEFWDGLLVANHRNEGKPLPADGHFLTCNYKPYDNFKNALKGLFQ